MSRAMELILDLLRNHVNKTVISREIGYSRTAVSRYVSGTYGAGVEIIESAILERYDRRDCPHTGKEIDPQSCRRKALSPRPFGGQARERQWESCQACSHNPSAISRQQPAKEASCKPQ